MMNIQRFFTPATYEVASADKGLSSRRVVLDALDYPRDAIEQCAFGPSHGDWFLHGRTAVRFCGEGPEPCHESTLGSLVRAIRDADATQAAHLASPRAASHV